MPEAIDAVGEMLNAFPSARDGVRGGWVGVMAKLLTDYPKTIALRMCDPVNGVVRECKFLPTVAEAVKWLEHEVQSLRSAAAWETRSREQLAERHRFETEDKAEPLEHRNAVAGRIKAELRAKGFKFDGDRFQEATAQMARDHLKAKYGKTDADLDALPNQPDRGDYWQGVRWPT